MEEEEMSIKLRMRHEAIDQYTNLLRIKKDLGDYECKELERQLAIARINLSTYDDIDVSELEKVFS